MNSKYQLITALQVHVAAPGLHNESDMMVTAIQNNITDLAFGLLHLQKNIAILEITPFRHPLISRAVAKAAKQGSKPVGRDVWDNPSSATILMY
uniref:Uncharacterized protein n=1 Tax=Amphimedon queenslandica TaxID=400682 RepID=A0A1X7VKY9_AMPQE